MTRLSLIAVLFVLTTSLALAEGKNRPALATHRLRPTAQGWLLLPPPPPRGGVAAPAPSPRPVLVPSYDPRFEITDRLLAAPQLTVEVEARWDGRRLRDVRRFKALVGGEELVVELSHRAYVARSVPLVPHRASPDAPRPRPILRLGKGWAVDVLSEGVWVEIRVHGPRGGMEGQVPASALDRGIASLDPEDEDDPFVYAGSPPEVTLLPEGPQPVRLSGGQAGQLFEEKLRPWHEISPAAILQVHGVHRERPDMAWVEASAPDHGRLFAYVAAIDLTPTDDAYPLAQRLRETAASRSAPGRAVEDLPPQGTGFTQVIQGPRLPAQEGSQARADHELLARCVAVQLDDSFERIRSKLEDLLEYGGEETEDELRKVRLDAARAVVEDVRTVSPAWDATDAALRSGGDQVVEILGSALTVYVENAKAGRPVDRHELQAFGDLRERIVAALEALE
jgi:hypothetical protein